MKSKGFIMIDALLIVFLVMMISLVFGTLTQIRQNYERITSEYLAEQALEEVRIKRCEKMADMADLS